MLNSLLRFWRLGLVLACLSTTDALAQNDALSRRAAIEGMYPVMLGALQAKNFGRARNICDQAIMWEPQNPVHHYNLACIEAQAGGPRLPYAWGALDLAIALGFNDAEHLRTDPDLLPLHSDPRFADLVRKVTFNLSAGNAISSLKIPSTPTSESADRATVPSEADIPPAPALIENVPVGLFYMTRYRTPIAPGENAIWYFAPDGTVLRDLERGFSRADVTSHAGPQGKVRRTERAVEITWADGTKATSVLERDGSGFTWDMRIFSPVQPFESEADVPGMYECLESYDVTGATAPVPMRLDLRADGTFRWEGVAFTASSRDAPRLISGPREATDGRWELNGFSLQMTTIGGATIRRFVFPHDDDRTVIKPDRMFFAGLMFKRRP